MRKLLSGNEALAFGALHHGVNAAFGYPGTPSTEILENLVKIADGKVACEWSPNEKVAMEAAAGAAMAGARAIVTMKCVGLNVAADPLMTLSYIGVEGGLVVIVADDPGQHSSQTEQDTRHYARLAKVPLIEPANAQEAYDYIGEAFALSERDHCPVILRTTTCVSHSRCLVTYGEIREQNKVNFQAQPSRWVPLPLWGRKMRVKAEERLAKQSIDSSASPLNRIIPGSDSSLGIISAGVTALYCREQFPGVPLLQIGRPFPFPDELIRKFAGQVKRLAVIEEGDPILEEHIKSLGIDCEGKNIVPRCGELTPARIYEVKAKLLGLKAELPVPVKESADLPARPPMLCPGCPHRALFYALSKIDNIIVSGDIGCYSLGVFPPLSRTDTILCMGGGFTVAHGMQRAGETKRTVGIVGDSTFFHSGITGLLDVVYNQGTSTLIVVDNRSTAMTGHQDHPGTGFTIDRKPTHAANIEDIAKACGMEHVYVCDPYDQEQMLSLLKQEIAADHPSLIISRAPCPLHLKKKTGPVRMIDPDKCKNCRMCLKCGCPAIEAYPGQKPSINAGMCMGCSLCSGICKFGAIREKE